MRSSSCCCSSGSKLKRLGNYLVLLYSGDFFNGVVYIFVVVFIGDFGMDFLVLLNFWVFFGHFGLHRPEEPRRGRFESLKESMLIRNCKKNKRKPNQTKTQNNKNTQKPNKTNKTKNKQKPKTPTQPNSHPFRHRSELATQPLGSTACELLALAPKAGRVTPGGFPEGFSKGWAVTSRRGFRRLFGVFESFWVNKFRNRDEIALF